MAHSSFPSHQQREDFSFKEREGSSPGQGPGAEDSPHYRTPPRNFEAEQALLGALLHNNYTYEKVSDFLVPEHFADPVHGRIFEAVGRLIERGQVADPITLKDYFDKDDGLAEVGGAQYLVQLVSSVVSIVNVQDYGLLIHDLYLRRQLIDIGENVVNNAHAFDFEEKATNQIEQFEQKLFDLATVGQQDKGFTPFKSALTDAIKSAEIAYRHAGDVIGTTTGLRDLDKWLGGLHPSDLLIVAGRPSMGKTAFATNISFSAAKAAMAEREKADQKEGSSDKTGTKGGVAFFSLEMSAEQLAGRLLSQEIEITSDKIRRGDLKDSDFPKFVDASRRLSELPLFIDDTPALTIAAIRTRARRLQRQQGLSLIVVDYLQLIQGSSRSGDNRVQEISEITRGLKTLAKELNVPVIALSQLSRAVEQREDKRPQLSDLRESGSIEQDADVVMFLYREEYYEARREPAEGTDKHRDWQEAMSKLYNLAEVIIAKQRHGPIGTVRLYFDSSVTRFSDLSQEDRGGAYAAA